MKRHNIFWRLSLAMLLAALAWLALQSPQPALQQSGVHVRLPIRLAADRAVTALSSDKIRVDKVRANKIREAVPVPTGVEKMPLWRVVTHRVISKEGIRALEKRLVAMRLKPVSIRSTEDMTMHAFDDAVLFKRSRQAHAMAEFWQQYDIETTVIKVSKGVYLLGLGRYFQAQYARELQKQLDHVGRKYRYQQRRVPIPVVRFTFSPGTKQQAEQLWKKLDATGVVMPVLISEVQFEKLYGNNMRP